MKNLAFAALLLFVGGLFASDAIAQKSFSKVVTDPSRWDALDYGNPEECTGPSEDCALKMLSALNISVGDEPSFSVYRLGETEGKNVTVVFVSHLVEDDDSLIGQLYRLELSTGDAEDKSYSLDGLGRMYQCMNGPIGWRKTQCQ